MMLKVTMTSLYKLIAGKYALPAMKRTQFAKLYEGHMYRLCWHMDGADYTAGLSVGAHDPVLRVITEVCDKETGERKITEVKSYRPTMEDLKDVGMSDE